MSNLQDVVDRLLALHDDLPEPHSSDPFDLILWENVAYLANDERRARAMGQLRQTVGTRPQDIVRATPQELADVGGLGILPKNSAEKLRRSAEIAVDEFDGDLRPILELPIPEAKRALRRFPGIGEPGAEKILLLTRRHAFLAPDSNALRVLVRLGFCPPDLSYAKTYAAAREIAAIQLSGDIDRLVAAHHVLRRHGQVTCKVKMPRCDECVLRSDCPFAASLSGP
jgi:endonuclease-3